MTFVKLLIMLTFAELTSLPDAEMTESLQDHDIFMEEVDVQDVEENLAAPITAFPTHQGER